MSTEMGDHLHAGIQFTILVHVIAIQENSVLSSIRYAMSTGDGVAAAFCPLVSAINFVLLSINCALISPILTHSIL